MTLLDLVTQGVRFQVAWVEVATPFRTYHPTVKVQGPKDRPDLLQAVRDAVEERKQALKDPITARRSVWDRWKAEGRPVWVRESKAGKVETLPDGVCELCGGAVAVVRGGVVRVEGIQCHLCWLARFAIVLGAR